jgi:putative heme iron utilization protein
MVQLILVELQPYPFGRVGFSGIELDYWNSLLLMIASALRAALNTEERESLLSSLNRMMGVKLCLYLTWRT